MRIRPVFLTALALLLTALLPARLGASEPAKEDDALAAKLLTAVAKSDYAAFVADGEPAFQQLKPEQFAAVASKLGPKLAAEHQVTYLGELNQKGYHVTLWRIRFNDGSDDALATLSVKSGKVGGFFIR